ncbi:hypothetical protein BH10PLA2_BH10PLA2_31590 [soil metagenome]
MFRSSVKSALNTIQQMLGGRSLSKRPGLCSFLERLATHTTPTFVSDLPVTE